ncbi:hypothetical protein VTK73DRAFT_6286 [Phialemonium thermophilum]|uniref:Uncharacterized protein n=1 Tax=Phialemonium thermophilum TaxID=223376 RepID=A0ABR3UZY1_9PEZI
MSRKSTSTISHTNNTNNHNNHNNHNNNNDNNPTTANTGTPPSSASDRDSSSAARQSKPQPQCYSLSRHRVSLSHSHSRQSSPKMSSARASPAHFSSQPPYLLVPNLHVPDPTVGEVDLGSHPWMVATVIEDDDLMFGGKPLSAWYEEERTRQSLGSSGSRDEEERRGRQRERARGHHAGHPRPQQAPKPAKESK